MKPSKKIAGLNSPVYYLASLKLTPKGIVFSVLFLQALARMGAKVTGIEPQHDNISAAIAHAQADPVVAERTTYLAVTAEELASSGLFHEQHNSNHNL